MTTIKRQIYRALKWIAIIAGLTSTIFGLLLGYNATQALNNISMINYQSYLPTGYPSFLYYNGIAYEFNAIAYVRIQFPNGTTIDSDTDYILYPYELTIPLKSGDPNEISLELLGSLANIFFLDLNMEVPPEAIDWARVNGKPLDIIGIFVIWFNLPIGGFNPTITPVTLIYINPYIVPPS